MCRADYGLGWEEFLTLSLAQLESLKERRDIQLRYARFNAALVASILINKNRSSDSEEEPVSPFDFIAGYETTQEEIDHRNRRKAAKKTVTVILTGMAKASPDAVAKRTRELIEGMNAEGLDGEEIVREVFPELEY